LPQIVTASLATSRRPCGISTTPSDFRSRALRKLPRLRPVETRPREQLDPPLASAARGWVAIIPDLARPIRTLGRRLIPSRRAMLSETARRGMLVYILAPRCAIGVSGDIVTPSHAVG
jgi:hypothetical protein